MKFSAIRVRLLAFSRSANGEAKRCVRSRLDSLRNLAMGISGLPFGRGLRERAGKRFSLTFSK